VVSPRTAINPTPKIGRRSMTRRWHERAADARRLADRLNRRTGVAGALRPGDKAAGRRHERAADSGWLANGWGDRAGLACTLRFGG
jgi:hypothetical protein